MLYVPKFSRSFEGEKILSGNVTMVEDREQRIRSGLDSLIEQLVPGFPGEDDESVDERQENALQVARSILDR